MFTRNSLRFAAPIALALVSLGLIWASLSTAPTARAKTSSAPEAKPTPTINRHINAKYVDNVQAARTPVANKLVPLDLTGRFPLSTLPQHNHFGESWNGSATVGISIKTSSTTPGSVGIIGVLGNPAVTGAVKPAGVRGDSQSGIGVLGTSISEAGVAGISVNNAGVLGQSVSGYAMYAEGNTKQVRGSGGWAKALVFETGGKIDRCYNSQQASPNTTPPCGFILTKIAAGDYKIDFGFEVDDRYIVVMAQDLGVPIIATYTTSAANIIRVNTVRTNGLLLDVPFSVILF